MKTVFENITKAYGQNTVFKDFFFELENNSITAVLGQSGSGKTTLLNILSGIATFSGKISNVPKSVSYIFQDTRLLPNLSVEKNLEYVLKSQIKDKKEREAAVTKYLELIEMTEHRKKYPYQLSGGQAQRVAIARAFAYKSEFLLMDEPFKEMDLALKRRLIEVFLRLYKNDVRTVVFVTHEIEEALLIADRIAILNPPDGISLDISLAPSASARDLNSKEAVEARSAILATLLK